MTNEQLKNLENSLWDSANALRAYGGLKASDYAIPVLGLIFLKFAENKYAQFEEEIIAKFEKDKGTRMEQEIDKIAIAICGFYLPEKARFDYLLNLPSDKKMAEALREAMQGIEKYQDEKFEDVLPTEAYFEIEKKKDDILPQLLKTFDDIPKDATGDVFGKIYEYFLGKFAMSEGQKGGEFFTPTSVVRFIVETIEPYSGKIYDPACGSGGMFVQSATFIRNAQHDLKDIYVQGQEYMGETVRLAKMNLLVNNLRGEITETNSYENDPYNSYGKFDYVMANPPFNVKSVKESTVKNDKRFYEFGLPKNKGKKDDKISDANYLWISLFATSLNNTGRAGFVMPNSASDARNAEYDIRKNIVDSGIVDCMVSMPSNMFFTVTLPATLWFFDKQKVNTERKNKILFLDARNVYHQIDRAHREWTEEHQQNLATIVRLYRGETERYTELIDKYLTNAFDATQNIVPTQNALVTQLSNVFTGLKTYLDATKKEKRTVSKLKAIEEANFYNKLKDFDALLTQVNQLKNTGFSFDDKKHSNQEQLEFSKKLLSLVDKNKSHSELLKNAVNTLSELYKLADKNLKLKNDKAWASSKISRADKILEEHFANYSKATYKTAYWHENINWLQSRFPDAKYQDITGLCKMADKTEYADEQDYSLNAGRYVGVVIEDDNITEEEFIQGIKSKNNILDNLNNQSKQLVVEIQNSLNLITNE